MDDEKLTLLLELLTTQNEVLAHINARLDAIEKAVAPIAARIDKFVLDLSEFTERFEELEQERRADRWAERG